MTKKEIKQGIIKALDKTINAIAEQAERNFNILETACRQCKGFKIEPYIETERKYPLIYAKITIDENLRNSPYYQEYLEKRKNSDTDTSMAMQRCFMDAPELKPLKLKKELMGLQWMYDNKCIIIPLAKMELPFDLKDYRY